MKYFLIPFLALSLAGPMAFAGKSCSCDKTCQEGCENGKGENCKCKTCDCSKDGKCKHGKCKHHAKSSGTEDKKE